jgi:hypothetical protein
MCSVCFILRFLSNVFKFIHLRVIICVIRRTFTVTPRDYFQESPDSELPEPRCLVLPDH